MKDYQYDYEWDANYCYPESNVLINKLNIKDPTALLLAEREITAFKIARAKDEPLIGTFNLAHLQKINQFIFDDLYAWAGQLRSVDITKGNKFCLCNHLETYATGIFNELSKENYLINHPFDTIPQRLAYYLSEINVLHPFREGNGRTQRLFIEYLGNVAGVEIDFSGVSDREIIIASASSFLKNYDNINSLFKRICAKTTDKAKENAVELFFGKNSKQYKSIRTK